MKNANPVFRKAVFGGFNREDVIEYITKLKNEFYDYKSESEKIINDLNEKIASLSDMLENAAFVSKDTDEVKDEPVSESEIVSNSIHEITRAAADLKSVAEVICGNFDSFFERIDSKISLQSSNIEETSVEETAAEEDSTQEASNETDEKENLSQSFFDDILLSVGQESKKSDFEKSPSHPSQFNDLFNF